MKGPTRVLNESIFREYDIRGIVDEDLTLTTVTAIAQASAIYLSENNVNRVAVGYDARLSSPWISDIIATELNKAGLNVINIGLCPTPVLYFSLFNLDVDGGVMVTASHNPGNFNGFKIAVGKETIFGEDIQSFKGIVLELLSGKRPPLRTEAGELGSTEKLDIAPRYIEHCVNNFLEMDPPGEGRPLKVIVDAGNGTAGEIAPSIIRRLGCEVVELFCEIDGTFPNHHPDPTVPENITELIKQVQLQGADLGIGFDGDSDRIGLVDNKGEVIFGDKLLTLLARDILQRNPGASVIYEVKCSDTLEDDIERHGGVPVIWKTGHSLIKAKMKETGALLAGEMSGHIFIKENYFGYDDAIYTAVRVIKILKGSDKSLHELLSDIPRTFVTPEIRVESTDETKFEIVDLLRTLVEGKYEFLDIDGVRLKFENGWGLVRASNTQPVLVTRFEAGSETDLVAYQDIINDLIAQAKAALN